MHLLRLLIAIAALTFFFTSDAYSQAADPRKPQAKKSPLLVGPVAGYNKSMHSGGFASIANDANCPTFETGTNNGYYFGLSLEYLLGDPKNANSSIIARAVYDYQPASFQVKRPEDKAPSRPLGSTQEISSQIIHTSEFKYSLLNFEVMYRFNLPGTMLGVTIGPQFGIPMSGTQEQRYELEFNPDSPVQFVTATEPGTLVLKQDPTNPTPGVNGYKPQYVDDTKTSIRLYEGDIIDPNPIRLALKAGVQYEILAGNLLFVPAIYYNFGLTNISTSNSSRVSAIQIGADLRFSL
ncbi:MAG: hypothetical protein ACKOFB_04970 [bacterium]